MAISRVPGPLLYSDLDRQGVDLQFTTNAAPLLYLDFAKFNVGVNTNTFFTTHTFTVNGSSQFGNIVISDSTISSTHDLVFTTPGNITLDPQGKLIAPHSALGNLTVFDTTIASDGNIILAPANGIAFIGNIEINGNAINQYSSTQIGNLVVTDTTIAPLVPNTHIYLGGTIVGNVGYPNLPSDVATVQYVLDHSATVTGNIVALTQGDSLVSLTDTTQPGKFIAILDNKLIATFANSYVTLAELTISSNAISSTGNITLLPALGSNVNVSGSIIANVGYPVLPTDAATVQYVQNSVASFNPNLIYQGDSSVAISDAAGPGGVVSVTVDGNVISTFSNSAVTLSNITISNTQISSAGNIDLTPAPAGILSVHSNTAMHMPTGLSSDRPSTPLTGYVRFNSSIGLLEVFNGTVWSTAQSAMAYQTLVGDNVTTSFALTQPELPENILVMINGVTQLPYTAYTVTGSVITFAEPPLSSEVIQIRVLAQSTSLSSSLPNTVIADPAPIIVGTTPVAIDSFNVNAYQSAKYTLSILFPDGNAQMADILVVQNRTTDAKYIVTATPVTGTSNDTISYALTIQLGICSLTALSSVPGTRIKLQKTYFTI